MVEHVGLFIVVGCQDDIVYNMFQSLRCLRIATELEKGSTYSLALVVDVFFDRRCLPDLVVILSNVEVSTVMQSVLDHQVVVFQFQILEAA